jgi:predicted nucleotidyltransferase
MSEEEAIVRIILKHFPDVQGIYLFGTYATADERPDSDVDIALLLPPGQRRQPAHLALSSCRLKLEQALGRPVDLLDARQVSTVFQKEIIQTGLVLYCANKSAVGEFEMLTLSLYQKLNEERKAILEAFDATGKAYAV